MNHKHSILMFLAAMFLAGSPALAQRGRVSPHETTNGVVDNNRIMIIYGRPYRTRPGTTVARQIWGGLVPYDKIWRTGADEATLMVTQQPIAFGDVTVPAGCYSLFTIPKQDGTATLIINKQIGQWGIPERWEKSVYDQANDVGRVEMKSTTLDKPVEQFTIAVKRNPEGGGLITLSWDTTQFSVPFTVQKPPTTAPAN
jgi:hypothetical protein